MVALDQGILIGVLVLAIERCVTMILVISLLSLICAEYRTAAPTRSTTVIQCKVLKPVDYSGVSCNSWSLH